MLHGFAVTFALRFIFRRRRMRFENTPLSVSDPLCSRLSCPDATRSVPFTPELSSMQ
jgi:hypothetical protein